MGETGASAMFAYRDGRVAEVKRHRGRESVGFFFGLVTDLCGFDQTAGEEWKVMGLAPYGRRDPELMALLRRLYTVEDGRLRFAAVDAVRPAVAEIVRHRPPDAAREGWADLARCGQDAFEEMMDALLAETARLVPSRNLVLCGGCALNSSFNGKIVGRAGFERLHVPSAPADDGNALGAAWLAYAEDHSDWRPEPGFFTPYLGSPVSTEPLERMAASGAARCALRASWGYGSAGRSPGGRKARRLGPGPGGVRPAGLGQPLHPRRSAPGRTPRTSSTPR
jgi:carbamoyltransferase